MTPHPHQRGPADSKGVASNKKTNEQTEQHLPTCPKTPISPNPTTSCPKNNNSRALRGFATEGEGESQGFCKFLREQLLKNTPQFGRMFLQAGFHSKKPGSRGKKSGWLELIADLLGRAVWEHRVGEVGPPPPPTRMGGESFLPLTGKVTQAAQAHPWGPTPDPCLRCPARSRLPTPSSPSRPATGEPPGQNIKHQKQPQGFRIHPRPWPEGGKQMHLSNFLLQYPPDPPSFPNPGSPPNKVKKKPGDLETI